MEAYDTFPIQYRQGRSQEKKAAQHELGGFFRFGTPRHLPTVYLCLARLQGKAAKSTMSGSGGGGLEPAGTLINLLVAVVHACHCCTSIPYPKRLEAGGARRKRDQQEPTALDVPDTIFVRTSTIYCMSYLTPLKKCHPVQRISVPSVCGAQAHSSEYEQKSISIAAAKQGK